MELRNLVFDPGPHKYTDEHNTQYTSVTTLINQLKPEYDIEYWSMYRAVDQVGIYRPRPILEKRAIEILYLGKRTEFSLEAFYNGVVKLRTDPKQIREEWVAIKEEACDWGTDKHNYLEETINRFSLNGKQSFNEIVKPVNQLATGISYREAYHDMDELERSPLKRMYPEIYSDLCIMIEYGFTIYTEVRMYSAIHCIAGTCDLLALRNNEGVIVDWKTNRKKLEMRSGYYKKVWNEDRTKKIDTSEFQVKFDPYKPPLSHLSMSKLMDYTLQLSIYAYICELWGLSIRALRIWHIKPLVDKDGNILYDGDGMRIETAPVKYKLEYRKNDIERLFNHIINSR